MTMKGISFEQGGVGLVLTLEDGSLRVKVTASIDDVDREIGLGLPPEDFTQLANFLAPKPYPEGGCVLCQKPKEAVMVVAEGKTPGAGVCDTCAVSAVKAAMGFANRVVAQVNLQAAMAEAKGKQGAKEVHDGEPAADQPKETT